MDKSDFTITKGETIALDPTDAARPRIRPRTHQDAVAVCCGHCGFFLDVQRQTVEVRRERETSVMVMLEWRL